MTLLSVLRVGQFVFYNQLVSVASVVSFGFVTYFVSCVAGPHCFHFPRWLDRALGILSCLVHRVAIMSFTCFTCCCIAALLMHNPRQSHHHLVCRPPLGMLAEACVAAVLSDDSQIPRFQESNSPGPQYFNTKPQHLEGTPSILMHNTF